MPSLLQTLQRHWPYYLMEAAGIATFVICSSGLAVLINHPASPVRHWLGDDELVRRAVLAVFIGLVVAGISYHPWGRRSGAHINPAVTLAFWQLGSLRAADAGWYIAAQFAGGLAAGGLMAWALAPWYAHPDVNFNLTLPGPQGWPLALLAETLISGLLMLVLLWALHSERLAKWTGWLLALLLALYVAFESPLSGMSLNPARSLGTAVGAGNFGSLWVYFVAPVVAMWLVAVLFQRFYHGAPLTCAVVAGCATKPEHGPYAAEQPQFPQPAGDKDQ